MQQKSALISPKCFTASLTLESEKQGDLNLHFPLNVVRGHKSWGWNGCKGWTGMYWGSCVSCPPSGGVTGGSSLAELGPDVVPSPSSITAYNTALLKALCCSLPLSQKSLGRGCTCRADSVPPVPSEPLSPTRHHLPLLSAIARLRSAGLGVSVSSMRTGVSLHPWQPIGLSCHFAVPPWA